MSALGKRVYRQNRYRGFDSRPLRQFAELGIGDYTPLRDRLYHKDAGNRFRYPPLSLFLGKKIEIPEHN